MLFLLRLGFWLMLVILLLPGSPEDGRRLVSSAGRTVSDVKSFCERNPEVCDDARVALTSIVSKLKSGAGMLQAFMSPDEKKDEDRIVGVANQPKAQNDQAGSLPNSPENAAGTPPRAVPKWQNSLNPADKQMPWRGPASY